jgi:hypothetical protein
LKIRRDSTKLTKAVPFVEGVDVFPGGIADKLGNRYEAKWLVRQLLDVVGDKAESLRFEGISASFKGFEFAVRKRGVTEWHQTKINNPNGNWTLAALNREGVLRAFKERLSENDKYYCIFVSQDPAKDIGSLTEKAKIASTVQEYEGALGDGDLEKFKDLQGHWAADAENAFAWLQRCEFRTESQSSIESAISTYSDLYFFKSDGNTFAVLRDFLEVRINKDIRTETARSELRSEGKLTLKDWSLDPTLRERLSLATATYLETYIPFGAGGSAISRVETCKLVDLLGKTERPSVVLLTGVAGSGKSGVIREFIGQLADLGVVHLALRIDQHLDCTSPRALGRAITDRDESPVVTLKGLGPDQLSVLIVDQVDAVSEVSGRNGVVKQSILSLVDNVRSFAGIMLIIVCRTFDLESDQRLKVLKEAHGVEHVDVQLLTWEDDVKPLLLSKSIDVDQFTDQQRELLRLPLNLAIFLETFDGSRPAFASRNDLFARLLERKGRSIRADRSIAWEVVSPLSKLAEWMSEQQRLDAPEDILSRFGGALDILSSEGLIVRSRGHVNFFHESFFDYIYARTFAARQQSLESMLMESEQHLFRRTQVRQILETLRQIDVYRYLQELRTVVNSGSVRYHIKVAVAQWLGSLSDPLKEEGNVILPFDTVAKPFPPLVRYTFFASPGWFDRLFQDGWVSSNLMGSNPERTESILWWLSNIAGQRPSEIAELLDKWWGGVPIRGGRLLDWFGFVKRQKPDEPLIDLCCRVIQSSPPELFEKRPSNHRDLMLHTWAAGNPAGASKVLSAYFDAWFEAHPNQHPFERDKLRDAHSLGEMAKKAPEAFIDGTISAFARSVNLIVTKEGKGEQDYSFKLRYYSGHHFGSDAFLDLFRGAMRHLASNAPATAEKCLRKIAPDKHEVFTHVWLETIAANGPDLHHMFSDVFDSPYLFEAGWQGTGWRSFAEAAKATMPFLQEHALDKLRQLISEFNPERQFASKLLHQIAAEGEREPWQSRRSVTYYISRSGYDKWCVLETIGESLLDGLLKDQLQQLRRKFKDETITEPDHLEARFVESPIKRERAAHMTDGQWLSAIRRYDNDDGRRRGRTFLDGGARQLAGELQHLAKEQPARFSILLDKIPDDANQAYVSHLLWGLAEAIDPDDDIIRRAILNAHGRSNHPYGSDIARLIEKQPRVAVDPAIFEILVWYVEQGEANSEESVDWSNTERELMTIEDLLQSAGRLHIRGINGARGHAAEALGSVIWEAPQGIAKAWQVLERRANEEPLLSVRCCLMRPVVPLFNDDRQRCAALTERLSRAPTGPNRDWPNFVETTWLWFAFPSERLPRYIRNTSIWCGRRIERFVRRRLRMAGEGVESKWRAPLLTHQGVYLLPFLLRDVPAVGKRLIYRLVVLGDDTTRMVGAWHLFRQSFQDAQYAPLADALSKDGEVYRRLIADIASHTVTVDEYRYRAENVLRVSFDDEDKQVRGQAADVFRNIKPNEFERYRALATQYLHSKAFEADSWAFFHALDEAECKVDDIVIAATEKLMLDIQSNGQTGGRRSMELHQLQDIIKKEYSASEADPPLRKRLLDLIDSMLKLELYGVDTIIKAHER